MITQTDLILQVQPSPKTCVQACIAMATGVSVNTIIAKYGDDAMNQELLTKALTECKILWNQFTNGNMVHEGWYFAVVPSLNHRGGNHQILLHFTLDTGIKVLDPAIGNKYKENGSDLLSWCDLTAFWPGGKVA